MNSYSVHTGSLTIQYSIMNEYTISKKIKSFKVPAPTADLEFSGSYHLLRRNIQFSSPNKLIKTVASYVCMNCVTTPTKRTGGCMTFVLLWGVWKLFLYVYEICDWLELIQSNSGHTQQQQAKWEQVRVARGGRGCTRSNESASETDARLGQYCEDRTRASFWHCK